MNKTTSPDDKMHPKSSLYLCPICKQHLEPVQRSFKCVNNHLFDIAKEGYINLLPVNKKRSKAPGDSKAMLLARRDFLTAGYYQCLVKALEETLKAQCKHDLTTVLDLGCGEGFYGRELQQLLADRFNHVGFWGADISKFAVQLAAKQFKAASYSVASAANLPYRDGSFDVVLDIFAPYSLPEVHRCLKSEGIFLLVGPGREHLSELAGLVYDSVNSHKGNPVKQDDSILLSPIFQRRVTEQQTIAGEQILNLLMMTPYYWSISEDKKQQINSLTSLNVTLDFELQVFKK